jgi:hypothetical protein
MASMRTRSKNRASRRSRSSTKTRSQKGGNYGSYPDSAWGFQMNNLGNGWTQFMNSLSVQPGQSLGTSQSNNIVPIRNINAQDSQPSLSPKMTGGRRRMRQRQMQQQRQMQKQQQQQMQQQRQMQKQQQQQQQRQQQQQQSRGKKGGYWGAVLETAAVPLALLGMQQFYGKRHTRRHPEHNKSFKRRR